MLLLIRFILKNIYVDKTLNNYPLSLYTKLCIKKNNYITYVRRRDIAIKAIDIRYSDKYKLKKQKVIDIYNKYDNKDEIPDRDIKLLSAWIYIINKINLLDNYILRHNHLTQLSYRNYICKLFLYKGNNKK